MDFPRDSTHAEGERDREREYTDQDPAKPGGRGSAVAMWAFGIAFALIVLFFFYGRQGC